MMESVFEETFRDLLRFCFVEADSAFDTDRDFEFMDKELLELFPDPENQGVPGIEFPRFPPETCHFSYFNNIKLITDFNSSCKEQNRRAGGYDPGHPLARILNIPYLRHGRG